MMIPTAAQFKFAYFPGSNMILALVVLNGTTELKPEMDGGKTKTASYASARTSVNVLCSRGNGDVFYK